MSRVVRDNDLPISVSYDELSRLLGYGDQHVPARVRRLLTEVEKEAQALIQPASARLQMSSAALTISPFLHDLDAAVLCLVTIGPALEKAVNAHHHAGELSRSLILNAYGSAAVEATADAVNDSSSGVITMTDGSWIDATNGLIDMDAYGNIRLSLLRTTTDVAIDTRAGWIRDNDSDAGQDIIATQALLHAATGIGADSNPLEVALEKLEASHVVSSALAPIGGGVYIDDVDQTGYDRTADTRCFHNIWHGPRGAIGQNINHTGTRLGHTIWRRANKMVSGHKL